ncbi:hypothetical protein ACIRON_28555 [Nocardioides sp. NPDC101246]|uniref:hypothetical protein n=1 Tax=Nocardioides sp. NPDC101246 TaxID=3364336 RepID=UPI0038230B02
MIGTIITVLVGGVIIGLLGKFLAPGSRDNIPFWLVVVCGIVGMLVGGWIYYAIFGVAGNVEGNPNYDMWNTSKGIDWWRHLWQVVVAAIAVVVAAGITGKSKA